MLWEIHRLTLLAAFLAVCAAAAVVIHRRDGVSYRTMCVDVLCYCVGSLLFWWSLLIGFSIMWLYSKDGSLAEGFLGWPESVPYGVWFLAAGVGAFIFGARWRYRIRHRAPINSLQPTREDARG